MEWLGKLKKGPAIGDDNLGAINCPKNSMALKLSSTSNNFTIGTGGGAESDFSQGIGMI